MAITRIATHNANRTYWPQVMATYAADHPADDPGLANVYYDGQMTCYRVADYTGDTATWYPNAVSCRAPYRDYWLIGQGGGQGYRVFPQGLAEDWIRNGNVTSKGAVNTLATTGYAINAGSGVYGEPYLAGEHGTRETSYALMALLESIRCGYAAQTARIATLLGYAKAHCDVWTAHSGTYRRPFMMALTAKALIQYYEQYAVDATIITKLDALFEDTWNTMWGAVDGLGSLSFQYTNVNTTTLSVNYTNSGGTISNPAYNSGGTEYSTNLNLLIAPVFGWLYKMTGAAKWKTRGDLIFDEGIAVYNGNHTVQIRGAYMGTPTNVDGKNVNQNFWWSDKYLEYTNTVTSVPAGVYKSSPTITGGSRIIGKKAAAVAPYAPNTSFTGGTTHWTTPADSTKVLDASNAVAGNGTSVKTVNPSTGLATLVQATAGSQGVVATGVINGRQGVTLTSGKIYPVTGFDSALNAGTTLHAWVVIKLNGTAANAGFFRCYDNSYTNNRLRLFLLGAAPGIEVSAPDSAASSVFTGDVTTDALAVGSVHLVEWDYDTVAATIAAYRNTTACTLTATGTALTTKTAFANTIMKQPEVGITSDVTLLDWGINVGGSMNKTTFRAAVKSQFGLTGY